MEQNRKVTATLVTIGDELLIGQVLDTNSAWMARELVKLGVQVTRRIAIADSREAIIGALDTELQAVDVVLMTGGLGPTADDITKPTLAEYFGCGTRTDEDVLQHVKSFFEKRKKPMLERNLRQAEVPDGCTVLFNERGTAPGMWFEKAGKIVVSMPGVPHEMMHLMEAQVLPRLEARLSLKPLLYKNLLVGGEGESFIAEHIKDLEERLPEYIRLAYLPSLGYLRLRLTCNEGDREGIEAEIAGWSDKIAQRLGKYLIAKSDLPMPEILAGMLTEKGLKIGLAESCTGGYIAHLLTQIPGASTYLQGSLVCYQPEAKIQLLGVSPETISAKGIVSEAVALQMARGAAKALPADVGLGITGWLGKEGDDKAPGGTVCMAVTMGEREESKTFHFANDRIRNKELAAQNTFLMLIRFLKTHSLG